MEFTEEYVASRVERASRVVGSLAAQAAAISGAGAALAAASRTGGTVYTCGNGGSAAQALHLSEELIGKYAKERPPIAAVCLNADPTALTCIANDFGYDTVFARQVEGLARKGDAPVVLSTSGASPNIAAALRAARERGATSIALLGKDGGACRDLADHAIVVPDDRSETIQEAHQVIVHMLVEAIEAG